MEEPLRLKVGGQVRTFARPYVLIGRHPGADVVVSRRETPRLQVYLQVIAGRLLAIDLSGGRGVRWDDGRRAAAGWLDPGRCLRVGPLTVRPLNGGSGCGRADLLAPLDATVPGPTAAVEVKPRYSGATIERSGAYPVGRVLTLLGRSRRCGIHLPDASVSDFHAALLQTPSGLWLIDLLGRGGVAVNGVHVPAARLTGGDALEIGGYAIRVVAAEAAAAPASLPAASGPSSLPALFQPGRVPAGPAPAETPVQHDELLAALMYVTDQFGKSQQRMLEQFLDSMTSRFQDVTTTLHDEQAALRQEVRQLRQHVEILVEDRLGSAGRNPAATGTEEDATGGQPADKPGEFYSWLAGRPLASQGAPKRRWPSLIGRLLGQPREASQEL